MRSDNHFATYKEVKDFLNGLKNPLFFQTGMYDYFRTRFDEKFNITVANEWDIHDKFAYALLLQVDTENSLAMNGYAIRIYDDGHISGSPVSSRYNPSFSEDILIKIKETGEEYLEIVKKALATHVTIKKRK